MIGHDPPLATGTALAWEKDGSVQVSTTDTMTYTLTSTYDIVLVQLDFGETSGIDCALYVNGDQTDYDQVNNDGSTSTGRSDVKVFKGGAFGPAVGELLMAGRWENNPGWTVHNRIPAQDSSMARFGWNHSLSSTELSSFTIISNVSDGLTAKAVVYGRDL
jgi:hypothetical protein